MIVSILVLSCAVLTQAEWPSYVNSSALVPLRQYNESRLYTTAAQGYDDPFYVLFIKGATPYIAGYSYSHLFGNETIQNYHYIIQFLSKGNAAVREVVEIFLDYEWTHFLFPSLPTSYQEELQGVQDGLRDIGYPSLATAPGRGFVLSSLTSDYLKDAEWIVINEIINATRHHNKTELLDLVKEFIHNTRHSCSHFGVWGSRTTNGMFYSARNLDWFHGTGVAQNKLLLVTSPPGGIPTLSITFAGLYGALTGISQQGITTHESGTDNYRESFMGFQWNSRLRYIMENAKNLLEAMTIWNKTENTVGINYGIGSGKDRKYIALETCQGYTAAFEDSDPRDPMALSEAVWRTNHALDPVWRKTEMEPAGQGSLIRYGLLHDFFVNYTRKGQLIGPEQAVFIAASVGEKSNRNYLNGCQLPTRVNASNVISVVYRPETLEMWLAYENGRGATRTAACCNNYVYFDLSQIFALV